MKIVDIMAGNIDEWFPLQKRSSRSHVRGQLHLKACLSRCGGWCDWPQCTYVDAATVERERLRKQRELEDEKRRREETIRQQEEERVWCIRVRAGC